MNHLYWSSRDLFWRLWNKISYTLKPRDFGKRQDTFPYLSSDGYALRSFECVQRNANTKELVDAIERTPSDSILYIPGHLVRDASLILERNKKNFRKVIIGDDDDAQSDETLRILSEYSRVIQSVNLVETQEGHTALPLGLESPSYRSGGRLRDFKNEPSNDVKDRPISFIVAWNPNTNNNKRSEAMKYFKMASDTFISQKRITASTLHQLMRCSLFVPCPRGNGVDSHRIWEALYLGSIPVLLREDVFPALAEWPIWIVDSWSDVLDFSRSKLEDKYQSIIEPHEKILKKSVEIYEDISR